MSINFDNTSEALLSLFQMMTTEGWMTPLFLAVDNFDPLFGLSKSKFQYFHIIMFSGIMVVASMFLVNLFIGVIIDNFNKIQDSKAIGGVFVTSR